jgi:hypothetical protein
VAPQAGADPETGLKIPISRLHQLIRFPRGQLGGPFRPKNRNV